MIKNKKDEHITQKRKMRERINKNKNIKINFTVNQKKKIK